MDLLDFELWKGERTITLFLKLFIHLFAITDLDSSMSGTNLVKKAIYAMVEGDCDEVRYVPHFATRGLSNPFTRLSFLNCILIHASCRHAQALLCLTQEHIRKH